jgi:hypothetical protein
LLASSDIRRSLDDIAQLVCQVILTSHRATINGNAGAHRRRRDGHDHQDHPFRTRILFGETKEMEVMIGHLFEYSIHFGRCDEPSIRLGGLDIL